MWGWYAHNASAYQLLMCKFEILVIDKNMLINQGMKVVIQHVFSCKSDSRPSPHKQTYETMNKGS